MKRVEPLIKIETPVLDYHQPEPPVTIFQRIRDRFDDCIDYVGGPGTALFISTVFCIGVGMSTPPPLGLVLVISGAVLLRQLLKHWSRSSRW